MSAQYLTAYEQWQIERYGHILHPESHDEEFENGERDADDQARQTDAKLETELLNIKLRKNE